MKNIEVEMSMGRFSVRLRLEDTIRGRPLKKGNNELGVGM